MRSLLSVLLISSGALISEVEAGPLFTDAGSTALPAATSSRLEAADALSKDFTGPFPATPAVSREDLLAQRAITPPEERERRPDARIEKPSGRKNPVLAGFLSAAIPGAGQIYNGSRMAYLFIGVEAAAWTAHFSMRDTGIEKERQYKRFADGHWAWERYRDPTFEDCPPNGHSDFGVQDSTLQSLYDKRRDDWYEDIGKLSIYACGWDTQGNRDIYRDMREDSNRFLKNARYATTVAFLNHLVSAVHAARGAARHNAQLSGRTEIDLQWLVTATGPGAHLTVSRSF